METPDIIRMIEDNIAAAVGSERVLESHRLVNFLTAAGVDQIQGVRAHLMNLWTEDQGIYSYEVGTHETIFAHDHEITYNGVTWKFEHLYSDHVERHVDLMDGLKTVERLVEQGVIS